MTPAGKKIKSLREIAEWRQDGICKKYPQALWFPGRGADIRDIQEAQSICAVCPVQDECREYSLQFAENELSGIWGGWTGKDRKIERHRRRRLSLQKTA